MKTKFAAASPKLYPAFYNLRAIGYTEHLVGRSSEALLDRVKKLLLPLDEAGVGQNRGDQLGIAIARLQEPRAHV